MKLEVHEFIDCIAHIENDLSQRFGHAHIRQALRMQGIPAEIIDRLMSGEQYDDYKDLHSIISRRTARMARVLTRWSGENPDATIASALHKANEVKMAMAANNRKVRSQA